MTEDSEGPLFRPEVAEARKQRLQGEIILAQPVRAHMLDLQLAVIIGVIISWIILGEYTRTETAPGILVTNAASKVIAIRPGLITDLAVEEGDIVQAGERLAVVRVEQQAEAGGSSISESLTSLDAQRALTDQPQVLARARAQGERERIAATIAGIRQQRQDIASQIDLQQQVVRSTQDMVDRIPTITYSPD